MFKNLTLLLACSVALLACTPTAVNSPGSNNNNGAASNTENSGSSSETADNTVEAETPDANTVPSSSDGSFRFISSTPKEVIRSNRKQTYHDLVFEYDEDLSNYEAGHFVRFLNMRVYDSSGDKIHEWKSSATPTSALFVGSTIKGVEGHLKVSEFAEQGISGQVTREIQATATETRFFETGNRVELEIIYYLGQNKSKEFTVELTL